MVDLETWGLGDWETPTVIALLTSPRHPVTPSPRHLIRIILFWISYYSLTPAAFKTNSKELILTKISSVKEF